MASGDNAFGAHLGFAAFEFCFVGGVLTRSRSVTVLDGLLGGVDLWTLGRPLVSGLVERSCVAAVAAVAGGLGVLVRGGRLVFGARDLRSSADDGHTSALNSVREQGF